MSNIYIIRHAQASFGDQNYDQLSSLGFKQADLLADHLCSMSIKFDTFYLGQNKRHLQTFSAYQKQLINTDQEMKVKTIQAFNEYDFEKILRTVLPVLIKEDPQLKQKVDNMFSANHIFQAVFEKSLFKWLEHPEQLPTLMSWRFFSQEVQKAVYSIMKTEGHRKNLAIFTSGGVISAVVQGALNLSDKDTLKLSWQILNTSITRFKYREDSLILSGFNDIGYLSVLANKGLITYR